MKTVLYRDGPLRGWCVEGFSGLSVMQIPWQTLEEQPFPLLVKSSYTRKVVKCQWQEETLFIKEYRLRRLRQFLARLVTSNKACREWHILRQLQQQNVYCPAPLIYARRKWLVFPLRAYLVTRELTGVQELVPVMLDSAWSSRTALLLRVAEFIRGLHERGFYHADFSAEHILIRDEAFALIDLDGAVLRTRPLSSWRRAENLNQFFYSLPKKLASRTHKLRVLTHYLQTKRRPEVRKWLRLLNLVAYVKGKPRFFS